MKLKRSYLNYKSIILEKGSIVVPPTGRSMRPMLRNKLDKIKLIPPYDLMKYDVIMYQRPTGQYIIHRIIKIINNNTYILSSDNQWQKEAIKYQSIIGVMEGFYRKNKYISKRNTLYILYLLIFVHTKFIRKFFYYVKSFFMKIFKKNG